MKTIIAFDVDGTLAPHNEPLESPVLQKLYDLVSCHTVVFISGKNTSYLSGLCRQLGIKNVYLSGENGAEYLYPAFFPPKIYKQTYQASDDDAKTFKLIRDDLLSKFRDKIWEQPNRHMFAFFPCVNDKEILDEVETYIRTKHFEKVSFDSGRGLPAYRFFDAIDILPSKAISKGSALTMIAKDTSAERIIAIGDAVNDISMMKVADYSIGIQIEHSTENHYVVKDISEALAVLKGILSD